MKIFCNCNSEWISSSSFNYHKKQQVQTNYIQNDPHGSEPCHKCDYWFWYDAVYENMMYDLKQMNI
jgi:hypothetical protein